MIEVWKATRVFMLTRVLGEALLLQVFLTVVAVFSEVIHKLLLQVSSGVGAEKRAKGGASQSGRCRQTGRPLPAGEGGAGTHRRSAARLRWRGADEDELLLLIFRGASR